MTAQRRGKANGGGGGRGGGAVEGGGARSGEQEVKKRCGRRGKNGRDKQIKWLGRCALTARGVVRPTKDTRVVRESAVRLE